MMKYKFFSFSFVSMLMFCTHLSAQDNQQDNLEKVINGIVQSAMLSSNTAGVAVAIHFNHRDYFYNYGVANKEQNIPVTKNTIFDLASITKVFTSTLTAVAVEQGKIKLNDSIVNYLPKVSHANGLPINQVKVVDLVTHTASFPRTISAFGADKQDEANFYSHLGTWQPKWPISTHYLYSNIGFGLLGKVLEVANNQTYAQMLSQNIASPLKLSNTFINVPPSQISQRAQGYNARGFPIPDYNPGFLYGAGALKSSSSDLLVFLKANLGIVNTSSQLLSAMQMTQKRFFDVKPNFAMGLGWQRMMRSGDVFITKNGMSQGFSTFIGFAPSKKFGVVVLANKRDANATKIGNQILNSMLVSS